MRNSFKSMRSVLALALLLASCTNIDIREEDAFDVKRTIDPRYFESSDYSLEEICFAAADGLDLEGWFISRAGNERTVLFIGGNGFVIAASYHIITSIIEQDVDLMVFNFRGYGTNPGSPTVEGVKADVEGAYRYLTEQRGVPPADLILHGPSLGSILAAGAANRHPVAAVVLESPLTDAKDLTSRLVPWILKPFVRFTVDPALLTVSNYEEVPKITVPILFITGGADNVTPKEMAEELYGAAETSDRCLHILEGGGHNDLTGDAPPRQPPHISKTGPAVRGLAPRAAARLPGRPEIVIFFHSFCILRACASSICCSPDTCKSSSLF